LKQHTLHLMWLSARTGPYSGNAALEAFHDDGATACVDKRACTARRQPRAGKLFWSSEDYWAPANWTGAQTWARDIIRNYVNNNMTATIAWSTIWAVLDGLPDTMSGAVLYC
jgi:hypothetical protein